MALQDSDLFVVQSQTDNQLYKLRLDALVSEIEGQAGVNFRGSADLNNPPATSGVTLPAQNGDLYMVESDAATIDAGWVMQNGETSAAIGDRIIYDGDNGNWILISTGSPNAGTVTDVTGSLPIKSDGNSVSPVISIREARTTTAAAGDAEGTDGAVHRLAEAADVTATTGTADPRAVVTADLLKATNDIVNGLALSPGGVTTVTTTDANSNAALSISPTAGNVVIELKTAATDAYGVVQIADASAITAGTAGPSAVVDASQLKDAIDALPDEAIDSITEGGTAIVAGALEIQETAVTDGKKQVTIGVNEDTFCPFDFSALPDITI